VTVEAVGVPGGTGNGSTGLGVWLRRGQRLGPEPAYMGVVRLLARQGARAATCLLGVDGTTGSRRERARFFAWNGSVPLLVLATGEPETIYLSADRIQGLLPGAEIELLGDGADPPGCAEQRLTVFGTEVRGPDGRPLHSTLVRNVREAGGSGASVLAGIYGFTGGSPPHGDSFFQLRRRVPVLTEIIDTKENCATWEGVVEGLGGRQVAVARAPVTVMRVRAD
jgi:PII-like signaling protein